MKPFRSKALTINSLRRKQLKKERERVRALEETNSILSAYLGLLIAKCGSLKVPKELVRRGIGGFDVEILLCDGFYRIKAREMKEGIAAEALKTISVGSDDDCPKEEKDDIKI